MDRGGVCERLHGDPVIPRRKALVKSRKRIARRTRPRSKGGRRFTHATRDPEKLTWVRKGWCALADGRFLTKHGCWMNGSNPESHHEPPLSRGGSDERIVPLCFWHHDERHRLGKRDFERLYRVDLEALAVDTEARWRAAQAGAGK